MTTRPAPAPAVLRLTREFPACYRPRAAVSRCNARTTTVTTWKG